jgi:curved DNA-binding protein
MRRGEPATLGRAEFRARGEDYHAKIFLDLRDSSIGATRDISLRVPKVDASDHVALRHRSLNVQIPKGVKVGQHIRLK